MMIMAELPAANAGTTGLSRGIEIYDGSAHCRECDPGVSGCPGITPQDLPAETSESGHECSWQVLNVQHPPNLFPQLTRPVTIVLMRCSACRLPSTVTLSGHWEPEQLA
jgi:hypothetical protein